MKNWIPLFERFSKKPNGDSKSWWKNSKKRVTRKGPAARRQPGLSAFLAAASICIAFTFTAGSVHAADRSDTEEEEEKYRRRRERMVEQQLKGRSIRDPEVLEAMGSVPRHRFVPADKAGSAYRDRPLSIGFGQTISQPYIVAYMTEILELEPDDKVLEIGTGSGYQAAVLAEITRSVYSIEIIDELASRAEETLRESGYGYVKTKNGDGYYGWERYAPFDAIIVTAAAGHIPSPLTSQLKNGGTMIIPVGGVYEPQTLIRVEKSEGGKIRTERLMMVRFVPMTGAVQTGR